MSNLRVVTDGILGHPYVHVLVTGPQRSGTRIAAKMLAVETGYTYIDENEFDVNDLRKLYARVADCRTFVVQAPGLADWAHVQIFEPKTCAVVWMLRSLAAIERSEKRIGWTFDRYEAEKYRGAAFVGEYYAEEKPSRTIKTDAWFGMQRAILGPAAFELHYDSLREHPLWVPATKRHEFATSQTEV